MKAKDWKIVGQNENEIDNKEEEPKGKVFKEFDKDKHVITLDPELLIRADQKGGVIISTDSGLYKLEKIST